MTNPDTPGSMSNSLSENKEETAKPADVPGPEGEGDGSTATNPPPVPESEGVTNPNTPGSVSNSLLENKEDTAKPDVPGHADDGDGSTATNPPPVPESEGVTNPEVHAGTPSSMLSSLSENKGDTAKNDEPVSKSDSTTPAVGDSNPPPVQETEGVTPDTPGSVSNSLSKNKEVRKSDNGNPGVVRNGGLGLPETPQGSVSTSNEDNRNDTVKPDGNVTIVKDRVESVEKETKKKYSDDSSDDTTNAGARPRFINFLGRKTVLPKPIDVMHAGNKILPLYEMCRLFLGINRDTASAFSSYSKIKAYYHKFQSTGSSERQFSVSHIDDGDEVTIYLKTARHFYMSKTCPIPEKKNV